jgi:hypothetical protein
MSQLHLTVYFLAGTDIVEAVKDAKELAVKLQVYVNFSFNGVDITCRPDTSIPDNVFELYHSQLDKEYKAVYI